MLTKGVVFIEYSHELKGLSRLGGRNPPPVDGNILRNNVELFFEEANLVGLALLGVLSLLAEITRLVPIAHSAKVYHISGL